MVVGILIEISHQNVDKIFDYHFSSNELSTLSYTDFDNYLYNQLAIKDNFNHMSG